MPEVDWVPALAIAAAPMLEDSTCNHHGRLGACLLLAESCRERPAPLPAA